MNDWRTILKAPPPPQNPQNPQNGDAKGVFEDIEDIEYRKSVGPLSPDDLITWEAADLTVHQGIVDFVHTGTDGLLWAFVTMVDGGWAFVNTKYAKRID
jgi:hypothetical protein